MSREEDAYYWQDVVPRLALELSSAQNLTITEQSVWQAIQILCYERFDVDCFQVFNQRIPYEELVDYFKAYDFSYNNTLIESSNGDLHYSLVMMRRGQVRHNGKVWIVHKYDADPFPSNPHAHDSDCNLKLHLGNGFIYKKKEYVGKLPYKEFMEIRSKLQDKRIALPELTSSNI